MPTGKIGCMLRIKGASNALQRALLSHFTYENTQYADALKFSRWGPPTGIDPVIQLAGYNLAGDLIIPRGVDVAGKIPDRVYEEFKSIEWEDRRVSAPALWPDIKISLNSQQLRLRKEFKSAREKGSRPFGNYSFVAPTAAGKTLASVALARATGQKTLVICITTLVMRAWLHDIKLCFECDDADIGIIKQNKWRIGDYITLASLQTLGKRRQRWEEINKTFGTVIIDEFQRLTGPTFYEFATQSPAKYLLGCTATPKPKRKEFYVRAVLGTPVHSIAQNVGKTATSIPLSDVDVVNTQFIYVFQDQNLDFNNLVDTMMIDEERNALIVGRIKKDIERGHTVLAVTRRRAHVSLIREMLDEIGVASSELTGSTNASRKYTDKLFKDIFSRKVVCIIATNAAVEVGANINPVDRIHFCMPVADKKAVEQIIGRGRRTYEGKKDLRVIYYLDTEVSYLNNVFRRHCIPVFRALKVKRYLGVY